MKQTEEIKAMIREMMDREMENFKEAVSNGEADETASPVVYTMLQVLMAKIEAMPYNGRYINSYQHRFGYSVRRYERGHIEAMGIFKSPQGDVTEPEKMVIDERE